MNLATGPIYEVVTAQILMSHRKEFEQLHRDELLPMLREVGIEPVLLLITEIGQYGRFLDVYKYSSMQEYAVKTDELLQHPNMTDYQARVGLCIMGSITVELARQFPHAKQ